MIEETRQHRTSATLFLLGAIPFLILAAVHWRYAPLAQFGDWAQYLLHADAVRNGRPYTDTGYIFTSLNPFIGPQAQPPGLPAFLVPLLAVTGGARMSVLYKLLMIVCTLGFLGGVAAYFARRGSRLLAIAPVLVLGVWLESGFVTNAVQPDPAFCAFVWAMFCLTDRADAWTWRRVAAVTVLGVLALAFRLAALPLIPALGVYALLHRRELGFKPWVPLLVWVGCGLAVAAVVPGALTFARLVPTDLGRLTAAVTESARFYPFGALEPFLYPFPWNHANDAYHVAAGGLMIVGLASWLRGKLTSMLTLFTVFTAGMLLVLPMQDPRYLMPLAPLSIYAAALGGAIVARWLAERVRRPITLALAERLSFAVVVAVVAGALGREIVRPRPLSLVDAPGVGPLFTKLSAEHAAEPMRVLFMNPRVLTWETGIPAMGFFGASPDSTLAELRARRITRVIVGDVDTDPLRATSIAAAVAERPDSFRRLYAEGVFTVYAFDPTRTPRP